MSRETDALRRLIDDFLFGDDFDAFWAAKIGQLRETAEGGAAR